MDMINEAMEITHLFPNKAIQHDCLVSAYGELTIVLKVSISPTGDVHPSEQRLRRHSKSGAINSILEKTISLLPDNLIVHKQDWFTNEVYSSGHLADSNVDQAEPLVGNEVPFIHDTCLLYITRRRQDRKAISSVVPALTRGRMHPLKKADRNVMSIFSTSLDQFVTFVNSTNKIWLVRLRDTDLRNLSKRLRTMAYIDESLAINATDRGRLMRHSSL